MTLNEYINNSDGKALNKYSKSLFSIYKIFEEKTIRAKTLREDIDEYIDFLDQSNRYDDENQKALKFSAVLNEPRLLQNRSQYLHTGTDMQQKNSVLSNSTDVYSYLNPRLQSKDKFLSSFEKKDFINLSPISDITDNMETQIFTASTKHKVSASEKAWTPDYLNDFNINIGSFFQDQMHINSILRPHCKGKLIDSPRTENGEDALSHSAGSGSSFQEKQLANKLCRPTALSVWHQKFEIWVSSFKQKGNHKVKPKMCSKKKELQRFNSFKQVGEVRSGKDISNNLNQERLDYEFLPLKKYSNFFIANNNKYFYDNAMINNKAYNTRHLILKETDFDRTLINLHHSHFTFTGLFSPFECYSCLKFIKDNNLQNDLKNSKYFKHYLKISKSLENVGESSCTRLKKRLSISEFWSGIKRELSFKLKRTDSGSMNTIGSLAAKSNDDKKTKKCNKGCTYKKYDETTKPKKPALHKYLEKYSGNFYYAISQEFINYFKNLGYILIEYSFCCYPVFKAGESELQYTEMTLSLTNEVFCELFMSWNNWYWRFHNDINKIHSKPIKCYICFHEIGDNMESILFRYKLNYFKDRLCLNCKKKRLLLLENLAEFDV